jgi:hypothetical protein
MMEALSLEEPQSLIHSAMRCGCIHALYTVEESSGKTATPEVAVALSICLALSRFVYMYDTRLPPDLPKPQQLRTCG